MQGGVWSGIWRNKSGERERTTMILMGEGLAGVAVEAGEGRKVCG